MPYARKRVYRKRTSARSPRSKRPARARRAAFPRVPRMVKPEVKMTELYFPMNAMGAGSPGEPVTTFINTYPTGAGSWNALIGTTPSQGTGRTNRIGDRFTRIGYNIDLYIDCVDNNVDYRFVCFEWMQTGNPDSITWPNPISASGGPGSLVNPWFPAKHNQWFRVLYQKAWRSRITATGDGSGATNNNVYRMHIKKFIRQRRDVSVIDSLGYAGSLDATATSTSPSYKNRIYWMVTSNNAAYSDDRLFGYVRQYFIDA